MCLCSICTHFSVKKVSVFPLYKIGLSNNLIVQGDIQPFMSLINANLQQLTVIDTQLLEEQLIDTDIT